ncbi:MAG: HAD family hydrolase [Chloroflexi bacterium]|nr:HAD family hydrolase [Chloroflexota bacterium]
MLNGYKAVFFDLDNTLCDYWGSSRQALTLALDLALRHYPALDRETLRRDYFRVQREAELAAGGLGGLARRERFAAALSRSGVEDTALAATLADLYEDRLVAGLFLFPDVLAVLDRLAARYTLGLLTNGPGPVQRRKLVALHLGRRFSPIVISEEVGLAKPDPRIFRYALDLAGVRPEQTLFVGDSLDHDVAGARAAGVPVVWLNRRSRELDPAFPTPDYTAADLWAVLLLLEPGALVLDGAEGDRR